MLFQPEIKTVMIPAEKYCREYRDPEQFIEYCKVCPRYNHLWCCPPFDFDTTEALKPYRYVYIVGMRTTVDPHLREIVTDPVTVGEMTEFITKRLPPLCGSRDPRSGKSGAGLPFFPCRPLLPL